MNWGRQLGPEKSAERGPEELERRPRKGKGRWQVVGREKRKDVLAVALSAEEGGKGHNSQSTECVEVRAF